MKARVIATGHTVDVELSHYIGDVAWYITKCNASYSENELEFIDGPQDYWTRLEHQYAGMAMQSYVSNNVYLREIREMCKEPQEMRDLIADLSILLATTLVEKLKEKEGRK